MNLHSSRSSFNSELRSFRENLSAAASRDVAVYEHKVSTAMRKLPYLASINPIKNQTDPDFMVVMRISLKAIGSNMDGVLKDFSTVLANYVIGSKKSSVCIQQTDDGFDYLINLIDEDGCYLPICLKTTVPQ